MIESIYKRRRPTQPAHLRLTESARKGIEFDAAHNRNGEGDVVLSDTFKGRLQMLGQCLAHETVAVTATEDLDHAIRMASGVVGEAGRIFDNPSGRISKAPLPIARGAFHALTVIEFADQFADLKERRAAENPHGNYPYIVPVFNRLLVSAHDPIYNVPGELVA